jgi:LPPG:FO 2-phospho-L-lactate transferase
MKLVALAGGTGAAKLLRGLSHLTELRELTIVVNTGDDAVIWGLHVSPDLDTVCYTLAGLIDLSKGWGLFTRSIRWPDSASPRGSISGIGIWPPIYTGRGSSEKAGR